MRTYMAPLAAFCLIALGACSTITTVLGTSVPAKDIIIAANGFDAAEATATTYIKYCTPKAKPIGCSDAAIQSLIPAIRAGRTARNNAEAAIKASATADVSLYNAIVAATQTLTHIETQYNVGSAKS